jgi:hypothetical protein
MLATEPTVALSHVRTFIRKVRHAATVADSHWAVATATNCDDKCDIRQPQNSAQAARMRHEERRRRPWCRIKTPALPVTMRARRCELGCRPPSPAPKVGDVGYRKLTEVACKICRDEERRRLALVGHMPTPPAVSDKKSTARFRDACSRGSK